MSSVSLLDLPKELLSQILKQLNIADLCQPALACGLLNTLCERQIYQSISVVRHAYTHTGETNYDRQRGFFAAIQKRSHRLSYIKQVNARLELREDSGLHFCCQLFEALLKMPNLIDLCLEIVGGVRHGGQRQLEQSMIWGCTFERGRMAIYKFFRINSAGDESRGFHALRNLRAVKVTFPSTLMGLQTDLMAYSALQHGSVRQVELQNIVNASLAPPKLPGASGAITHLTMKGCRLPPAAYQGILASISALEYFDYRPARPMGSLPPGGLVKALDHHKDSLRTLSIKAGEEEMSSMDLSAFTDLTHLQINNIMWNEEAREVSHTDLMSSIPTPASFPPFLETLTMRNFHTCSFNTLIEWMDSEFAVVKAATLPNLKLLRLEAEQLGDEWTFDDSPIYVTSASGFHVDGKILALGIRYLGDLGVKLCVNDSILFGQEAHMPGPYETGPQNMVLRLDWECRPQFEGSEDVSRCAKADMAPKGAIERLLLLRGNNLNGYLSWQNL